MGEKQVEKSKPKYSTWDNVLYVIDGIKQYDKWLLPFVAVNIVFSALSNFVPVIMPKFIIDQISVKGSKSAIIILSVIFGLLMLISNGIKNTSENSISNRFISVRLRFIARSGKKFMTMDYQNLEDSKILDISQKGDRACNNNSDGVEGVMHRTQWASSRILTLLSTGAVIVFLSPVIIAIIIALILLNFIVSTKARKLDKKENDLLAPVWRKLSYIEGTMSDFSFAKDIRLFNMKNFITKKYKKEQNSRLCGQTKILRTWYNASNMFAVTNLLQEIVLYAYLCYSVLFKGMSIGNFTMYLAAIHTFSTALDGLFGDIAAIKQQNEVICDYRSFLDYPDNCIGNKNIPPNLSSEGLCFEFQNVSFKYPGSDKYALKDLSLKINPSERLAVVGLNGAGKSTFVKLLTRLYEPESGRILLNGTDIRSYDKNEYYSLFSVVFQKIEMFAFTVAENVSMDEYEKTDINKVKTSIDKAGLIEKINSCKKGIDTTVLKVIDDDGIEFSGGESQKLALARALYKNAPCIVLDEPTSALDALAEERMYKEFDSLIGNKTAIYISHRLASTKFCDRIIVFENGKVAESGTHDELIEKGGKYAELFNVQAKYYKDEEVAAV